MLAGVASAYHEVRLSRERLEPAREQLESAEKALRLARANFQGGLLTESDLLLAQQAANQARRERLSVVAQFNLAQLDLLTQAGVGSVEVFGQGAGK
jgi:outer membrane protein TolC